VSADRRIRRQRPSRGSLGAVAVAALIAVAAPTAVIAKGGHGRDDEPTLRAVALHNMRYHSVGAAERAGYSGDIVPMCMDDAAGGMGVHWIDAELLTDGEITPLEPEALVYEVGKRGKKRLVAVEWVMPPNDEYPPEPEGGTGPTLFGQAFTWHGMLGVWKLHAWLYRSNPAGIFADYNVRVAPCPTS
jgi:hypothetical protein